MRKHPWEGTNTKLGWWWRKNFLARPLACRGFKSESILKCSNLNCFHSRIREYDISILRGQEPGLNCDKNMRELQAYKQWQLQCAAVLANVSQLDIIILIERKANNSSKGFSLFSLYCRPALARVQ